MTKTDPALEWFQGVVEPTVAEFLADPDNKRRGCLAALAVASMTEHYFCAHPELAENGGTLAQFKRSIRQPAPPGNAALGIIAEVANATKHVVTTKGMSHHDIRSQKFGVFGQSRFGEPFSGSGIVVEVGDAVWLLTRIIESTMAWWREKLAAE